MKSARAKHALDHGHLKRNSTFSLQQTSAKSRDRPFFVGDVLLQRLRWVKRSHSSDNSHVSAQYWNTRDTGERTSPEIQRTHRLCQWRHTFARQAAYHHLFIRWLATTMEPQGRVTDRKRLAGWRKQSERYSIISRWENSSKRE